MTASARDPRVKTISLAEGVVVHALYDGGLAGTAADYHGIDAFALQAALDIAGQAFPPRPDLICYLVQTSRQTILVDAGAGKHFGDTAGFLHESLALIRLQADDIDTVFLTHCHGDHVGGLIDAEGAAVFRNARIMLSRREWQYWRDSADADIPQARHRTRDFARKALDPYREKIVMLNECDSIAPAVTMVALNGHTPGHSGLAVEAGGAALFIAGDLLHLQEVQLPPSHVTTRYDWDSAMAAASREALLFRASGENTIIAGMHFRWPGFHRVYQDGPSIRLAPLAN